MHTEGGNVLEYWPLSKYFPADQAIYALQAKGLEGETVVSQSVEEMAESFLSEVQRVQPKGPFYLGGYCLGGLVAYEMARQLITRGEKVNFLALISARTPDYLRKSNSNASMVERLVGRISERVRLERDNLFYLNWNKKYNYLRERVMRLSNLIQVNGEIVLDQIFSRLGMPVDWHSRDYILNRSVKNQDHAFAAYKPKPCQRVKELEAVYKESSIARDDYANDNDRLEKELAILSKQLKSCLANKWKARCEKAETELAALKGITAFNPNNAASNVQSGIIKQSQGEPFGWYWESEYEDGIVVNDHSGNYDVQPDWTPLYTAQTIPEGWQLVRTEDIQFCLDAIQDWGAYAGEYFQDKWELDKDIERAKAMVKGPYTKIDDLILKMEIGKVYTSKELCEIWGQHPKSVHKARTRLLVKYPSQVEAYRRHDEKGYFVVLLKTLK